MFIDYSERMAKWYLQDTKMDLVLSDDIDSLASCALLNKVKGWKVEHFYDFENLYSTERSNNEKCWVDVAVLKGKGFDNHLTKISTFDTWNQELINPNTLVGINNDFYYNKYAGSTLLVVWSIYKMPLPETEEGKMLLLCIDSAFKGHYVPAFEETNQFYLCNMLEFGELYDVMERHTDKEFYALIEKYGLNNKIKYIDGKLTTNLDLETIGKLLGLDLTLEDVEFTLEQELTIEEKQLPVWVTDLRQLQTFHKDSEIFTLAFTYKDAMRYSTINKSNKEKENLSW